MSTLTAKILAAVAATALLSAVVLLPAHDSAAAKPAQRTVVYHLDDDGRAPRMLRNIENHRRADPDIRIVVVALAGGVGFLLDGAKDDRGSTYASAVDPLMLDGVEFRVCNNTMKGMGYSADKLLQDVAIVPAGVAEIARLQIEEGAAYIKP